MAKVLVALGTRPEAIKLAPVVHELDRRSQRAVVVSTGQHREMLDQACADLDVRPDYKLDVMQPRQSLASLTSVLLHELDRVLQEVKPDAVLVQGDTTTAFTAALAAFYNRIPVGHVEAGLRTGNLASPFPEEGNRRLISEVARWHFAPTTLASQNLLSEGMKPSNVFVTGNTVIDALLWATERARPAPRKTRARRALVTLHRRENHGEPMVAIAGALKRLAARGDLELLFPVHKNPAVRDVVDAELGDVDGIHLVEPLDYLDLVGALQSCDLVLTDSGGLQEEAPALGKPVLVLRDTTERPEAIHAGTATLVGIDPDAIVSTTNRLLDDPRAYAAMANAVNPFGDGRAASRIADVVLGDDDPSERSAP